MLQLVNHWSLLLYDIILLLSAGNAGKQEIIHRLVSIEFLIGIIIIIIIGPSWSVIPPQKSWS